MIPSIATVCVSGTLLEKLEAIASAGFKAVEIFENDLIAFPGSPAEVRRICADLGLTIITCQPFRDFEGMPEARRQRTFDRARRKFDLLQELGCDLLFVCSSVSPEALSGIDRLAADFAELGEYAGSRGLRVGYEALAWGRHVHDYRDAWEIVRRANRPEVGIVLDSFHILARGLDLSAIGTIPRDKIAMVQMADAPLLQMDPLSWSRHWRCLPGQGDFDLVGFMRALVTTGYDGVLSLEIFNDRFRAGSARSVALDGHRSLIWLLDETQRRVGRPIPGAVEMPPPGPVEAVEFLEFAIGEAERPGFEGLLRAIGFVRSGAHRSKDVDLWSQGDIRIVLNSEADGFAHSYQIVHGTSICALALRVPDAQAATARARALLDVPYAGSVGPGELDIPAVRGVGGSLVYFLDRDFSTGPLVAGRLRAERRERAGRRFDRRRSRLAKHAIRGNAHLAIVLFVVVRGGQDADPGRDRSRRRGAKPGDRKRSAQRRRSRPAPDPQRFAEPSHAVGALHYRILRLGHPAHRLRDPRYRRHR